MDTELTAGTVDTSTGAPAEPAPVADQVEGESPEATAGTVDLDAVLKKREAEIRAEYEDKGGHLAKLRSKYDTQISQLKRELEQRRSNVAQEALQLMGKDPVKAAEMLAGLVQEQAQESMAASAAEQMGSWQRRIMEELGFDLDGDDEAAELALKWNRELVKDPGASWDFQQDVARRAREREAEARKKAEKELASLKDGLQGVVQAEITKILASSGIVPDPGTDGSPQAPQDWRKKSTGQLVTDGLAKRIANPQIKR
jgi:hypothetical protein